jgi:hypothetical protein
MLVFAFSSTAWASGGGDTIPYFKLYIVDSLNRAIFNSDSVAGPFGKGDHGLLSFSSLGVGASYALAPVPMCG